jgi:hypothetical protein
MEYVSHQIRRGRDKDENERDVIVFELRQLSRPTRSLIAIGTTDDLKDNLATFNADASNYAARAMSILHQTTYWVYEEERDQFGPSKFLGYAAMDFALYDQALRNKAIGTKFDGHVARRVIEETMGQTFAADDQLSAALIELGERLFGPDVFAGVDQAKWQFVKLASIRRFWAFAANPNAYHIDAAVAEMAEDFWTVTGRDVRRGDEFLVWRTTGGSWHRGVVALGRVLSDPQLIQLPAEYHRYCIDPTLLTQQPRVRIRYEVPTGLPLWLDDDISGTLSKLSVAHATGGSVFHVDPVDWNAVTRLVGEWRPTDPSAMPVVTKGKMRLSSQGFSVDPRVRLAVEKYAVEKAIAHYKAGGYEVEERGNRTI